MAPKITRIGRAGELPYDALITADGRHYIAGLFGEDGLAHIDLWNSPAKIDRILDGYGKGEAKLPVYKMPHLEGWALAGGNFILPAVGRAELLRRAPSLTCRGTPCLPPPDTLARQHPILNAVWGVGRTQWATGAGHMPSLAGYQI